VQVNYVFFGVVVPSGAHNVTVRYY
jgi:hypothetical protein